MSNLNYQIILLISLILLFSATAKVHKQKNRIIFDLKRNYQPHTWDNYDPYRDVCIQQSTRGRYPIPSEFSNSCANREKSIVYQSCELNNVAYTMEAFFSIDGKSSFYSTNTQPSFQLQVDLNSPWSWIKTANCQHCNREGSNCDLGCPTNELSDEKNQSNLYTKGYYCIKKDKSNDSCKYSDYCGIIAQENEGLQVQGKFGDVQMTFDSSSYIKNYRMIIVSQMAFQFHRMADGIIGLAPEADRKLKYNHNIDGNTNLDDQMEGTGFISHFQDKFDEVNMKSFSIKLGDQPKLVIGEIYPKYAQDIETYNMTYVDLPRPTSDNDSQFQYYKWQVPINRIEIMKVETKENRVPWGNRHIYEDFMGSNKQQQYAQISISSSALVVPKNLVQFITSRISQIYGVEGCQSSKNDRNFVVCRGLEKKLEFKDMIFLITLGQETKLHIDPKDLIKECKKNNSGKYDCVLEIQESFANNNIILGEVALQNSYIDFDIEGRKIGFTHQKNSYIKSLFSKLENIVIEVSDEIINELQFVMRFYFVIFGLVMCFLALRNINGIIRILDFFSHKFFNKRLIKDNIETQRLVMSEQEISVQKCDDDENIGQRIYDMQIEAQDQSSTLEDADFNDEI